MKIEYRAFNTVKNKYEESVSVLLGSEGEPFSLIPHGGGKYSVQLRQGCKIEQFTGLTDKNGTKIFENDIVRILYTDWASKSENDPRTLEEYLISISDIGKVVFNTDRWELEFVSSICPEEVYTNSIRCGLYGRIEVIGNIHDNPELLK